MKTMFSLNRSFICRALLCTVAVAIAGASSAVAQEVLVTVGKGVLQRQVDSQAVQPFPGNLYHFTAAIYGASPELASSTFLRTEGGRLPIPSEPNHFFLLDRSFASRSALDATFPNGTYTVEPHGAHLRLAGNDYPNTPYIVNWDWAQDIDTTVDFVLKWVPFSNPSANDLIFFEPFISPVFPTALDPAAASMTVPANLLQPDQTVSCRLVFFRTTSFDVPEENPGVAGYGGYYRETRFTIRGGAPAPPQGRIQFSDDTFIGSESDGGVHITLTRTSVTRGKATVVVSTVDGSARDRRDYTETRQTVTFDEGVFYRPLIIPVVNDSVLRGDREFYVVLSDVTGGAEIRQPNAAVVRIVEDEQPSLGELQFSSATYSVTETDDFAALKVLRAGDLAGTMTVFYSVEGQTANAAADFAPEVSVITFEEGQAEADLLVAILDDADFEANETFQVRLYDPSAGASLASPSTATVTIRSDDLPDLVSEHRIHNVAGRVNIAECRLRGGRAEGVIEFQSQEGSQFVATGFLVLPQGRLTQTFRGRVTSDGRLSGAYSWRGNGDRGTGSFTGRYSVDAFLNPSIRLSFGGRSRIYGCRQAGQVASAAPPGEVAGEISSP